MHQGYGIPGASFPTEETNKFFTSQLANTAHGPRVFGYPGMANEELMTMIGQQNMFANSHTMPSLI